MNEAQAPVDIYQFRLSIRGISPAIWRRVLIRSDSTLADLHYIIQILMGWSNFYLHQFTIHGKRYAVQRLFCGDAHDAEAVRLCDLRLRVGERFLYEYSFFEWWQHEIRLEKKLALGERKTYPVCIAGKRAAPPEDRGGAEGFMRRQEHFSRFHMASRLLDIFEQFERGEWPDDDESENYLAELKQFHYWLNVEHLDRKALNQRLKWYTVEDERWAEGLEVL